MTNRFLSLMRHRVDEQLAFVLTRFRLKVWQYLILTVLSFAVFFVAGVRDDSVLTVIAFANLLYWFTRFYLAGWHWMQRA